MRRRDCASDFTDISTSAAEQSLMILALSSSADDPFALLSNGFNPHAFDAKSYIKKQIRESFGGK